MAKKLIDIEEQLQYKMKISREMEAMAGNKMTLDKFYEKIISLGLETHKNSKP